MVRNEEILFLLMKVQSVAIEAQNERIKRMEFLIEDLTEQVFYKNNDIFENSGINGGKTSDSRF